MPRKRKKTTSTASYVRSKEIIAEFQRIHPYLHTHFAVFLGKIATICAFVGFVVGNTSLVGTFFRNQLGLSFLSPFITRPVIAVSFVLLGIGLLLTFTKKRNLIIIVTIDMLAVLSTLIISISLLSRISIFHQLIYSYFPATFHTNIDYILRAAPNATLILLLLSVALLFLQQTSSVMLSQALTLIASMLLFPTDIGFLYGNSFIYSTSTNTKLALITTVGLNVFCFSMLFAKSHMGIIKGITEQTTGGFFSRRFVFLAIAAPLALGWLDLTGYNLHWYGADARFLLLVTSTIVTFLIWAVFIARSLQSLDGTRRLIQNNLIFLSEASKILSSSLNYTATLRKIAQLSVTQFADWCSIELLTPDNKVLPLAVEHANPRKKQWAATMRKRKDILIFADNEGLKNIIKNGKSQLFSAVTLEKIQQASHTKKEAKFLQDLAITSVMQIPIRLENKTIGVMQFVSSNPKRIYTISDVHIAEELASRASLAVENAKLYRNAQDAIKVRDEFISMASHELKTPLTSLKVYTELLLKKYVGLDIKTTTYLTKMDDQIINLTNLIKDLLDVSRIQVGKLAFHFESLQMDHIVRDIVDNFQPTVPHHNIRVEGNLTHSIIGDKERLGQVVLNFLTNAVKYSPNKDTVVIKLSETPEEIKVEVKDFGIGIEKKYLPKVFERFYQVGSKKTANIGLGMGLYISSEIVKRHLGTISAHSIKGKGSTFAFTIPVSKTRFH